MIASPGSGTSATARARLIGDAGLIHSIKELVVWPGEPRLHFASSLVASLEKVLPFEIPGDQGGVGFTWDEAAAAAIGETVERYCAAVYHWEDLTLATQEELGPSAIGMDRFALYTDEVYAKRSPLVRWTPSTPAYWVRGRSLITGASCFLPAAMVYVPYRPKSREVSDFFAFSVSSGQACHTDREHALLSALCEAVERDAFLITWMRRIAPCRLDYRRDAELNAVYRQYFECGNLTVDAFDITLDIAIPTVLAVARGLTHRGPFIAVGAASRPRERDAAIKAMKECVQGAAWARGLVEKRDEWRPAPDFSNVTSFEDHVRLYCEPEMPEHCRFILETSRERAVAADGPEPHATSHALQAAIQAVARAGLEAYVVDLTTPDIAELGFHVPKVIVPGLAHLTAIHALPALLTPRYRDVPQQLGLSCDGGFNPIPHPFP